MRRTRANKQSKTRADADRIVCAHVCTWNFLFLSRSSREKKKLFLVRFFTSGETRSATNRDHTSFPTFWRPLLFYFGKRKGTHYNAVLELLLLDNMCRRPSAPMGKSLSKWPHTNAAKWSIFPSSYDGQFLCRWNYIRVVGYHSGANSRETPVLLLLFPAWRFHNGRGKSWVMWGPAHRKSCRNRRHLDIRSILPNIPFSLVIFIRQSKNPEQQPNTNNAIIQEKEVWVNPNHDSRGKERENGVGNIGNV